MRLRADIQLQKSYLFIPKSRLKKKLIGLKKVLYRRNRYKRCRFIKKYHLKWIKKRLNLKSSLILKKRFTRLRRFKLFRRFYMPKSFLNKRLLKKRSFKYMLYNRCLMRIYKFKRIR